MRRVRLLDFGLAVAIVLAACTGSDDTPPGSVDPATTTSSSVPRETDGRLRLGLLLPRPGDSPLGEGVTVAAEQAVTLINRSGGVLGIRVDVATAYEGSTLSDTQRAFEELNEADVDAVVGPTSSLNTLAELGTMVDSGVLVCSPTASALSLDEFPDDGLFFRTIPSDSLQAVALAEQADRTGARKASVMYFDDRYGRGLAEAVTLQLEGQAIPSESTAIAPADDDLRAEAASVLRQGSEVVIVIGDNVGGPRILSALGDILRRDDELDVPDVIVNDGMRDVNPDLMAELPSEVRAAVIGVGPTASPTFGGEPGGFFATNSYDCVTTIALAAEAAGSDVPTDIAAQMQPVTNDGSLCRRFSECAELLGAGLNIDYDGPGGALDLGPDGDPLRARFDLFDFDGVDEEVETVVVRAP